MGKKKTKQKQEKYLIFIYSRMPQNIAIQDFPFRTICVIYDQEGKKEAGIQDKRFDLSITFHKASQFEEIELQLREKCGKSKITGIIADNSAAVLASHLAHALQLSLLSPLNLQTITALRTPDWNSPFNQITWDWWAWVESAVPNACPSRFLPTKELVVEAIGELQSESFSQWRLESLDTGAVCKCSSQEELLTWFESTEEGTRTRLQAVPAGREFTVVCVSRPEPLQEKQEDGGPNSGSCEQQALLPPAPPASDTKRDCGGRHRALCCWEELYSARYKDGLPNSLEVRSSRLLCDPSDRLVPYRTLVEAAYAALTKAGVKSGGTRVQILAGEQKHHLVGIKIGPEVTEGCNSTATFERQVLAGKSHLQCTLDCLGVDGRAFEELPAQPPTVSEVAAEVSIFSNRGGMFRSAPGKKVVGGLNSQTTVVVKPKPWEFLQGASLLGNPAAQVVLWNTSTGELEDDLAVLRPYEMGREGFLDFEIVCSKPAEEKVLMPPEADSMEGGPPGLNFQVGIAIVDPYSSGIELAKYCHMMSIPVMTIYSQQNPVAQEYTNKMIEPVATVTYGATNRMAVIEQERVNQIAEEMKNLPLVVAAVMPGAETGVELADALAQAVGCRGNSPRTSPLRCDKYAMGSALRRARLADGGRLRTVREARCRNGLALEAMLLHWGRTDDNFGKVIVKPCRGCGTEDVKLCQSKDEAFEAIRNIIGRRNYLGVANDAALVQEFLEGGTEYALDSISRDGVHKIVAIWKYDKRSTNKEHFVYFGMQIVSVGIRSDLLELITYHNKVLDVLGVVDGPAHTEIMMTKDGPVFIEIGARIHGGSGSWLPIATSCIGYNQFGTCIDAFVKPACFDALPPYPFALLSHGREAHLVTHQIGKVKAVPGLDQIKSLKSYRDSRISFQPGMEILPTTNCFTRPGSVQLIHTLQSVVDADYEKIRDMEEQESIFEIEPEAEEPELVEEEEKNSDLEDSSDPDMLA